MFSKNDVPLGFSMITVPTYLTLARIALVPCIVASIAAHSWVMALLLLALAGLTDIVDGPLARWLNQVSVVGAVLDPCADKLLLFSCYISLFLLCGNFYTIPLWFILFTLISELLFVGIALYLVFVKKNQGIRPSKLGKLTGLAQVLFIGWFLTCRAANIDAAPLFFMLLFLIVLSRLYAFIDYGIRAYYKKSTL